MKPSIFVFFALSFATATALLAQDNEKPKGEKARAALLPSGAKSDNDSPAGLVSAFFGSLQKAEVDQAYASLTKGSKIAEKPEEIRQLKAKTKEAIEVFGAVAGYDLVETKAVGHRLIRSTYVSLGKAFPLRWRFYFYKPDDVWRLIDLRVDDKLTSIFDEPTEPKEAAVDAAE